MIRKGRGQSNCSDPVSPNSSPLLPATTYIVASADNAPYLAWQAKLFHYSCVTYAGAVPLLIVHGAGERPLEPDLADVVAAGGVVCRAPSFRRRAGGDAYLPRNTPGSLLAAADLCDKPDARFVLCDADMLFVRAPRFGVRLSGDRYDYLAFGEPRVQAAARRLGIDAEEIARRGSALQAGVPHVIPAALARPLAETWLDAIDAFEGRDYIDSMYAFALAAVALDLDIEATRHMVTNADPAAPADAAMIHYCYGDDAWSKRHYLDRAQAARVWDPPAHGDDGSIQGTIARQLREAGAWYAGRR